MGLDADQSRVLGAAIERIAPVDEAGPGALELGVLDYIAATLDGAPEMSVWAAGLAALDECAEARHATDFAACPAAERDAILADLECAEAGTELPEEAAFFESLRDHVLQGMFGDPSHGGNRDGGGWKLLGYPGPRLVWGEAEQQLDVVPAPASTLGPDHA
jgi:Gluconate 2-dehydrogenase subunit 3